MMAGRIVALIFAVLLLLPGGCFLWVGISEVDKSRHSMCVSGCGEVEWFDNYLVMLPIAVAILSIAGLLFWAAFRRRRSDTSGPP